MKPASPFKYGSTVSGKAFTGRKTESKQLIHNLINGIHTVIISPRRWGKSSLVEKVVHDITKRDKSINIVLLDLFTVSSEQNFLEMFAREVIKAGSSKLEDRLSIVKSFFKQLSPRVTLGIDPNTDFSISFDWNEAKIHRDEILNLPEELARKKNIRLIICLDEFQNITNFEHYEELEKAMRAAWQRHKHVSYCLYGSKRHMMENLFRKSSNPFYRFGDIMFLKKIPKNEWIKFIMKGFKDTGKFIPEKLAEFIPLTMEDHPWYVQQFASYTWRRTENTVTASEISEAMKELIFANLPLYQNEIENLSGKQVNLLRAIYDGEVQLTSTRVMRKYDLGTPINITRNKKSLEKNDMIYPVGKKYEFLDPAFKLWFMLQYYKQDASDISNIPG